MFTGYKTCRYLCYRFVLFTKYFSDDKTKKNEMSGSCSTYGGEEGCIPGFDGGT